MSKFVLEL
ncbi:hypothetical protein LINPERPRIM_LOCUS23673 [Linum perenne]